MSARAPTPLVHRLDASRSTIAFSAWAPPPLPRGTGHFARASGTLVCTDGAPLRAEGTIDVASLTSAVRLRDRHLLSSDFLDSARHPTIDFVSDRIAPLGGGRYLVVGELTIRGVRRVIELRADSAPIAGGHLIRAGTAIDRRHYGVQRSRLDVAAVGRTVEIRLELCVTPDDP